VTKPRPRQEICQNPERVKKSAAVVVLVGEKAKSLQFSDGNWYWRNDFGLLIVVVNLNNKTGIDKELCPPIIHIPFKLGAIKRALRRENEISSRAHLPGYWPGNAFLSRRMQRQPMMGDLSRGCGVDFAHLKV